MSSLAQQTTYPIFAHILEARERELVEQLPTLYPNEPDRRIAQEVLLPLWRSCLTIALDSFMERTRLPALGPPIAEAVATLCADVDKAIRANRFLCDVDGRGKPIYEYIVGCRSSVVLAIVKEFEIERERAETQKHMRRRSGTSRQRWAQSATDRPRRGESRSRSSRQSYEGSLL